MRAVAKERYLLFIEAVKRVHEDGNFKIEELHYETMNEVSKVDLNYSNIHTKVDVVADVVKKIVEFSNSLISKVDLKSKFDSKGFAKLEELLWNVKEQISKINVSPSSSVAQEALSNMFSSLESKLRDDLTPLIKFINLMPSNAPPVLGARGIKGWCF